MDYRNQELPIKEKRNYYQPQLAEYGSIVSLTLGASGVFNDDGLCATAGPDVYDCT
jgi:hypothetical protein